MTGWAQFLVLQPRKYRWCLQGILPHSAYCKFWPGNSFAWVWLSKQLSLESQLGWVSFGGEKSCHSKRERKQKSQVHKKDARREERGSAGDWQGSQRDTLNRSYALVLGLSPEALVFLGFQLQPLNLDSCRDGTSLLQPKQKKGDPYKQSLPAFSPGDPGILSSPDSCWLVLGVCFWDFLVGHLMSLPRVVRQHLLSAQGDDSYE